MTHKFSEQPDIKSIDLVAEIKGNEIRLINNSTSSAFPKGVITSGKIQWHAATSTWIIARNRADKYAKEVGGCSTGPEVIDLQKMIYWTC